MHSRVFRRCLLVPQHRRHHPRGRRVERGAEVEAGLYAGWSLNGGLGQRQIDFVQGDGQAAVRVDGEGQSEFRRRAARRLGQ